LRQEQVLLLRALEGLPLDVQILIALHYVQGLRSREIADVLDIPTSTVTTRLQRAREALKQRVETMRAKPEVRDAVVADLDHWTQTLTAVVLAPAEPESP
jgi:DNA-directed RNA polymerase specialized sigma24 family protein